MDAHGECFLQAIQHPPPRVGELGWDAGLWQNVRRGLCIGWVEVYMVPPVAEHMGQRPVVRVRGILSEKENIRFVVV